MISHLHIHDDTHMYMYNGIPTECVKTDTQLDVEDATMFVCLFDTSTTRAGQEHNWREGAKPNLSTIQTVKTYTWSVRIYAKNRNAT